ncbi:MAG: 50S ribosomal protein L10 [Thermoplasmata archaeon]|nr:50S ribosomal protein L10 [Thermoplasmata archaeon]
MARPEKVAVVEEVRDKLRDADAAVLTEYRGLSVTALAELRGALRPASTEYKVFKNTLARRAAESAGLTDLVSLLEGPVAIAFVHGDAVVAAKALRDFGRANPALIIKGGLLGDRVLAPRDVESLADIQPRDVLLARLAAGFQAPLVKAAGLFQAFNRNFAYGLQAYIDQRVEGGESLPPTAPPAAEPEAAPAVPSGDADTATPAVPVAEPDPSETPTAVAAESESEAAPAAGSESPAEPTGDAAPEEN